MRRILVASPKGGCGKTTLATTLAVHYARAGERVVLIDCDHQASTVEWGRARGAFAPPVPVLASAEGGLTSGWTLKIAPGTDRVIIDTPAGLRRFQIDDLVRRADAVLVPVVPSAIDVRATLPMLADLRAAPPVRRGEVRVALVANRVKARTLAARELDTLARQLPFPLIARVRDTQAYVLAGALGRSVFDYATVATAPLREDWLPVLAWLEQHVAAEAARPPPTVVVPFVRP